MKGENFMTNNNSKEDMSKMLEVGIV
jgi:hypothetical protein